ncbi:hypothetical protein CF065_18790 [Clostridium sporogenes]
MAKDNKIYIQDINFIYYECYSMDGLEDKTFISIDVSFDYKMMNGTINIPADKLKDISLKEIKEYIAKEMR